MVVVVGVDTSDHSIAVVRKAVEEARRRDAALHVVHVFHPPVIPYLGAPVDLRVMAEAEREAVWNQVAPHLANLDIEVDQAVAGDLVQHMVEEGHARVQLLLAGAVQIGRAHV